MQPVLELAYQGFLKLRPALKRSVVSAEESSVPAYPAWLKRELRSDHAGETGAVGIYRGIIAVSRCPTVGAFARRHLETESRHLDAMCELVPPRQRSKLLPFWYLAGFTTGALPALIGNRAVFGTVEAVETFVDKHYAQQIERLESDPDWQGVRETLVNCHQDELAHRDEAHHLGPKEYGLFLRLWLRARCDRVGCGGCVGQAFLNRSSTFGNRPWGLHSAVSSSAHGHNASEDRLQCKVSARN